MTFQDIVNYYMNHPPVEVSDMAAYADLLNIVVQTTVHELSENDPILEEKLFKTGQPADLLQGYLLPNYNNVSSRHALVKTQVTNGMAIVDLYKDIDPNFMEIVTLYDVKNPPSMIDSFSVRYNMVRYLVSNTGYKVPSMLSLYQVAGMRNIVYTLKEWFSRQVDKLIFNGTQIKLQPNTEYYILYYRYRTLNEMPITLLEPFKQLLDINLKLTFYSSDVESGESQIRSVSISGLSVTFNVPSADQRQIMIQRLGDQKDQILSQLAIDYDDGEIGLI